MRLPFMTPALPPHRSLAQRGRVLFCVSSACYLLGGVPVAMSQNTAKQDSAKQGSVKAVASAAADSAKPRSPAQLESLVAPIALYPDELLAQTLVASTYPLEIVQLQQWLAKHPTLKDKALADSVAKQPWDPSIQSMAPLPDVVKRLADDVQWTTELGNAFLAQQSDVMDAVQRMRKKAKDKGALESNKEQKVETKVVEKKTVIVVESQNPEVIYVPSYSPTVVYGAPMMYPYPPIYYPPYPVGAAVVSFGIGMAWGAAIWGGSCCHAGWGHGSVNINVNNNYNRINHYNSGGGGNWQHNPQHRGGAPYADARTEGKFGASNRGAGVSDRAAGTGQGQRGAGVSDRAGIGGQGQRGAGVSDRAGIGGQGQRAGVSDRAGVGGQGQRGAGVSDRSLGAGGGRSGGGDQIGNRSIPRDAGSRGNSAFGGGASGRSSGASARASSSRGASSMGSRGGMSRGGGGGRRR
jgi:hypothetical protein